MPEESQNSVLDVYINRRNSNNLSDNLMRPTTANLRNECALVFHGRADENIKNILESFGPIGFNIASAEDILNIDPDKFRPLSNFMNGGINNPSQHNVKLLVWLIDFGSAEDNRKGYIGENFAGLSRISAYFKENKLAIIIPLIVVALGIVASKVIDSKQCMYWQGDHYEVVGCKIKIDHASVIALDEQKVNRLKRITRIDTLGEKDLGKVWYVKIRVDSAEFYTDSGAYPLDARKRLLPITPYILNKYILKKDVIN